MIGAEASRPEPDSQRGRSLFRPRARLDTVDATLLVLFVGAGVWVSLMALFPGLPGIPCLFRATTGFECPGCGLTRACVAFARGDPARAIAFNPLSPFVVGFVGVRVLRALSTWFLGRALPPPLPRFVERLLIGAFVVVFANVVVDRVLAIWRHVHG
jgi:hypothetical protein